MKAIFTLFAFLAVTILSFGVDPRPGSPLFRFGAVADCQYCEATSKNRKYNLSPKKLTACVQHYNKQELSFVVHLGDFIDRDFESFDKVVPIYNRLKAPHYHVLGNHDFSVVDDKKLLVPAKLGLKQRYYDFARNGWRFIVIDGNDVSLYAWPKGDPPNITSP
jgi:manganese-dependent ADP-ribose/CDP-alcohol diphosphatase